MTRTCARPVTTRKTAFVLDSQVKSPFGSLARRTIRIRADLRFTRAGADLRSNLHIGAPDAALGITTAVPTLQGQARVRVPPGTRPGSVLRVAGKGLPRYDGHGRGSLNLTVILDIPRPLSPRQRELYEQLRAEDAGTASTAGGPLCGLCPGLCDFGDIFGDILACLAPFEDAPQLPVL
jgi:DnaJ-class molecular chaperone